MQLCNACASMRAVLSYWLAKRFVLQALLSVMPLCPAAYAEAAGHLFTTFRQDSFL